jgi:hypothetical protein
VLPAPGSTLIHIMGSAAINANRKSTIVRRVILLLSVRKRNYLRD